MRVHMCVAGYGSRRCCTSGGRLLHLLCSRVPKCGDDAVRPRGDMQPPCRHHPDVNKSELAEAKFQALSEAYQMLLGRSQGGHGQQAPLGGNWGMHDWYWHFSLQQRQRRQRPEAAAPHSAAAARAHRPAVEGQLAGLKQRAAARQQRCALAFGSRLVKRSCTCNECWWRNFVHGPQAQCSIMAQSVHGSISAHVQAQCIHVQVDRLQANTGQ